MTRMVGRAFNLLRPDPHYRRDAFDTGLRAVGYDILAESQIGTPQPSDALVIWNRYAQWDALARRFEKVGAAVLVAENGYIGATENEYRKPFTAAGEQLYALALNHHNGAGRWWIGESGRWRDQGIQVKPWHDTDDDGRGHILVLPQRGIGPAGVAMPAEWPQRTLQRLRALTHREVRVRSHPGNEPTQRPLEADLAGCWCVVTWGSGAALKAMCAGVPAYSNWPQWIGHPGALPLDAIGRADEPHWWHGEVLTADAAREVMLDRLAWAQNTVAELATGEPLKRLLELYARQAKAA